MPPFKTLQTRLQIQRARAEPRQVEQIRTRHSGLCDLFAPEWRTSHHFDHSTTRNGMGDGYQVRLENH